MPNIGDSITVYAPATIANLGPGYDILGLAITGLGDRVSAEVVEEPGVWLDGVTGDGGLLPMEPSENTASYAAIKALEHLDTKGLGLRMTLHKGLPLGSGMGSSAASAVAGAFAAYTLFGSNPTAPSYQDKLPCLNACCEAEKLAAGVAHADNVAPSLLGGVILIRRYNPLEVVRIPVPQSLRVVVAMPNIAVSTRQAREVLPHHVRLTEAVANSGNVSAMIAGFFLDDPELIGRSMTDAIVEPVRAPLIPAFLQVKRAALDAGALGCTISGAGPACFALSNNDAQAGRIAVAMERVWSAHGVASRAHICRVDTQGARVLTA